MRNKPYTVYILTDRGNTVLYTGVTNDMARRLAEHRAGVASRFTRRYGVTRLVYMEHYADPYTAISREKQIKAGSRAKKVALIERENPEWRDLA